MRNVRMNPCTDAFTPGSRTADCYLMSLVCQQDVKLDDPRLCEETVGRSRDAELRHAGQAESTQALSKLSRRLPIPSLRYEADPSLAGNPSCSPDGGPGGG